MEVNITKNEMEEISSEYHSLNDRLMALKSEHEEEMQILSNLENEVDFAEDYLKIESAKVETIKNQIYNNKKRYINKREFNHSIKTMLLGFSFPLLALFIPDIREFCMSDTFYYALTTIASGLVTSAVDVLAFMNKNADRYAKEYYKTEKYKELIEEQKVLEESWREKLSIYQEATNKYRSQYAKTDRLMKSINNTRDKILILKEKLFNKMLFIPEEQSLITESILDDKPIELKRK